MLREIHRTGTALHKSVMARHYHRIKFKVELWNQQTTELIDDRQSVLNVKMLRYDGRQVRTSEPQISSPLRAMHTRERSPFYIKHRIDSNSSRRYWRNAKMFSYSGWPTMALLSNVEEFIAKAAQRLRMSKDNSKKTLKFRQRRQRESAALRRTDVFRDVWHRFIHVSPITSLPDQSDSSCCSRLWLARTFSLSVELLPVYKARQKSRFRQIRVNQEMHKPDKNNRI